MFIITNLVIIFTMSACNSQQTGCIFLHTIQNDIFYKVCEMFYEYLFC